MIHQLLSPPLGPLQVPIAAPAVADTSQVSISSSPVQLSLIIPTYNERDNIVHLVSQLAALLDERIPNAYELILVDDDSPDRTWELGQQLTNQYSQLQVMRRQHERGLSSAVIRGWQIAQGSILGVIDADLQHPPEILLELLQKMMEGADLSVASRHVEGGGVSDWSLTRRFLSRGAQVVGLLICPAIVGRVSDPMSGYFMVQRSAIAGPILNPLGYKILLEVLGRGNIQKIVEVGYIFQERTSGASKVTWKQYVDYLAHLAKLRLRGRFASSNEAAQIRQKFPTVRFVRYSLVGLSGVFVDMTIFYIISAQLGQGLTQSKVIAAEVTIISNFWWNDTWTFADLARQQPSWSDRFKRLLKFNLICTVGLAIDVVLLNIFYNLVFAQKLKYLANLMAIALAALWNCWINLNLNWRTAAVLRQPPSQAQRKL